jgi:RNA polymerase sigma factor (sigma-70 family)
LAAVPSIGRASRIERGLAPEADATRALYEQYANQVFRYCLHQLGSREEAEDALQSTFLNAFRGIKRGVVPDLESAWLFKIAHNVCLSRRRSTWRRGRIESPADFEVIEELAPAPSRRADELIGLQDVLERLPETQRRAILLREWQGLSYREIAAELELSQAAVETLIFRARRSLANGLEQPETKKRRIARALDWGNVFSAIKTALVGGSAAAKIAATVAVVSATTVVAAAPVQQHRQHHQTAPVVTRTHASAPAATTRVTRHSGAAATPAAVRKHSAAATPRQEHVGASVPAAPVIPTQTPEPVSAPASEPPASAPETQAAPPVSVEPAPETPAPTQEPTVQPVTPQNFTPADDQPIRLPSSAPPSVQPVTPTLTPTPIQPQPVTPDPTTTAPVQSAGGQTFKPGPGIGNSG